MRDIAIKTIGPEDFPDLWSNSSAKGKLSEMYDSVPWLYRAVIIRAQSLSRVPFAIMRNGQDIDTSDDYQNVVGWLKNPTGLFALIEAALCLHGAAYLMPVKNKAGVGKSIRWLLPTTITPKVSPSEGLVGWERNINAGIINMALDDLIYMWQPNPFGEVSPGTSPAHTALAAAGVLHNVDDFAATFFERGAIKATILTVDGVINKDERDKLKSWWTRAVTGVKNAFSTNIFNAASVKPVVIGDGIAELSNNNLTAEKREDIATAIGVPHSLLFSNAANYATAQQDDFNFYDKTIVPELGIIQSALNDQLFQPQGLTLKFRPDSMDVFQHDEQTRSTAYANYTASGLPHSIVAEMLGLELPPGIEYDQLDEYIVQHDTMAQIRPRVEQSNDDTADEATDDLMKWQRKSIKRLLSGKSAAVEFESDNIPMALNAAILGSLDAATDVDGIKAVFDSIMRWEGYP